VVSTLQIKIFLARPGRGQKYFYLGVVSTQNKKKVCILIAEEREALQFFYKNRIFRQTFDLNFCQNLTKPEILGPGYPILATVS